MCQASNIVQDLTQNPHQHHLPLHGGRYISLIITGISQLNLHRDKLLHTVYECGDCWEASTPHLFSLWFLNMILSQSFLLALCLSVAAKCKYATSVDGPLLAPLPCFSDEVKPIHGFGCFRGQTTIKHQRNKHSRLEFPVYLLLAILSHRRPVFVISDICQNKGRLREQNFAQASVEIIGFDL